MVDVRYITLMDDLRRKNPKEHKKKMYGEGVRGRGSRYHYD